MRRNQRKGLSYTATALIAIALMVLATFLAFTKRNPFADRFEIRATMSNANQLKQGTSVVRIAGVNVGKVTKVEHVGDGEPAAVVTMELSETAQPVHTDATLKVRPRIFFEGNFFVDLSPGSPSKPKMGDGDMIPINNTAAPVQFDQVLGALQSDTRKDLKLLLSELNKAYSNGGSEALNRTMRHWEPAYKNSAIVNDATLGILEHDLSGYVSRAGRVAEALDRNEVQLKSLITDLHTTGRALSAEDEELSRAIAELPRTLAAGMPALAKLNGALPSLRRFTAALRPGVRSSGPALTAQIPLLRELRGLLSADELGGLASDLRPTVPSLAQFNKQTIPLLEQLRSIASCQNEVVLPWTKDKIEDPEFPAPGPVYQEQTKPLVGLAGESRSFDANGQWFRVALNQSQFATPLGAGRFLLTDRPILGANPPRPAKRSPLNADVPCETQQQPDLRTQQQPMAQPSFRVGQPSTPEAKAREAKAMQTAIRWLREGYRQQGQKNVKVVDDLLDRTELPKLRVPGLEKVSGK
jgi:phospholipid/cholesterol/gamma-HCH transport system substrate-binding protein